MSGPVGIDPLVPAVRSGGMVGHAILEPTRHAEGRAVFGNTREPFRSGRTAPRGAQITAGFVARVPAGGAERETVEGSGR